jgi:pSer/pThr/pTyr-binding forkhead associated (FHA) protein
LAYILDFGSSNGTLLNGKKHGRREAHEKPGDVDQNQFIDRSLAEDVRERYANAAEMYDALNQALQYEYS